MVPVEGEAPATFNLEQTPTRISGVCQAGKQLYSKSAPLVAKLVQNAGDNKFSSDGIPSTEFEVIQGNYQDVFKVTDVIPAPGPREPAGPGFFFIGTQETTTGSTRF
jgi:hypothetical protein